LNSDFSQGFADELYDGQESEENIKHLWEDEFKVSESVKEFKIKNNTTYTLAGFLPNNNEFSYEIGDMTVINCITKAGNSMQFAVSKKILKKTSKYVNEKKNETHLFFYLRDTHEIENPMNGVYILKSDFPKELSKKG
jgi:hypothetical protein